MPLQAPIEECVPPPIFICIHCIHLRSEYRNGIEKQNKFFNSLILSFAFFAFWFPLALNFFVIIIRQPGLIAEYIAVFIIALIFEPLRY